MELAACCIESVVPHGAEKPAFSALGCCEGSSAGLFSDADNDQEKDESTRQFGLDSELGSCPKRRAKSVVVKCNTGDDDEWRKLCECLPSNVDKHSSESATPLLDLGSPQAHRDHCGADGWSERHAIRGGISPNCIVDKLRPSDDGRQELQRPRTSADAYSRRGV